MKRFLFAPLAASLLLFSCGSTPEAPFEPKENFNDNFAALEEGNVTVVNPTLETKTYYYNLDAVYREYDDSSREGYGYLTLADQGMFGFTFENETVKLGNTLSLSSSDHASLMLYSPSLLSENASFRKGRDGEWTSTHENTLATFAYIAGLGVNLSSDTGYAILTQGKMRGEEKKGGILQFDYSFSSNDYSFSYSLSFEAIGKTQNKTLDSFLAAHPKKEAASSWSSAQKASIAGTFGTSLEVPYPSKASPYNAFTTSSTASIFIDYGENAKELPASYAKQLEADGFVLNQERSSLEDGEASTYLYEKDKQVEDPLNGKGHITYEAVFGFVPVSMLSASDAARFPNGKFILNFKVYRYIFNPANASSLNLYLRDAGLSEEALPSFSFQSAPSSMFVKDTTALVKETLGSSLSFNSYYVVGCAFENLAQTKTEMANYVNALVLSGFQLNSSASSDGASVYYKALEGYPYGITVQLSAQGATSAEDKTPWLDVEIAW